MFLSRLATSFVCGKPLLSTVQYLAPFQPCLLRSKMHRAASNGHTKSFSMRCSGSCQLIGPKNIDMEGFNIGKHMFQGFVMVRGIWNIQLIGRLCPAVTGLDSVYVRSRQTTAGTAASFPSAKMRTGGTGFNLQ
jgi:hypothetical protein